MYLHYIAVFFEGINNLLTWSSQTFVSLPWIAKIPFVMTETLIILGIARILDVLEIGAEMLADNVVHLFSQATVKLKSTIVERSEEKEII